jgi:hypothetical protein
LVNGEADVYDTDDDIDDDGQDVVFYNVPSEREKTKDLEKKKKFKQMTEQMIVSMPTL